MPTYQLNINDTVQLTHTLNATFDRMSAILPDIEESALKSGAMSLKEKVKSVFVSKFPSATRPIQKPINNYQGTPLVEGVRQSKVNNGSVKVHILGSKGLDMTWMTRFYEYDTKERYQKTYKGKKLKSRKHIGKLTGVHFFMPTVEAEMANTIAQMGKVYETKLEKAING